MSPSFNVPDPSTVPLPAAGAAPAAREDWEAAASASTGQPVDRRGDPSSSPLNMVKPDSHCATVSMQVRESS